MKPPSECLEEPTYEDERPDALGAQMVPQDFLFVVLDCDAPMSGGARYALDGVDAIEIRRGAVRDAHIVKSGRSACLTIDLPGRFVSRVHARFTRVRGSWRFEDAGSRNGSRVNGVLVTEAVRLGDGDVIECGHSLLRLRTGMLAPEGIAPIRETSAASIAGLATLLPQLETKNGELVRIARAPLSLLFLGESGTGKDVLAREAHAASGRSGELVPVNCGSIPSTLVESLLFGHVRGAFSGAVRDEPGLFRAADRGTLFLDELGDMPLASQAAILRVLEDGRVCSVGSTKSVSVDVRIMAATLKPLDTLIERGLFRPDLLARLSGFTHRLPPLRDRIEDLGLLVRGLLPAMAGNDADRVSIEVDAGLRLIAHSWPLNVRELRQCLASTLALSDNFVLSAARLPTSLDKPVATSAIDARSSLEKAIRDHGGNLAAVGRALGKDPAQVRRWIARHGIDLAALRKRTPEVAIASLDSDEA